MTGSCSSLGPRELVYDAVTSAHRTGNGFEIVTTAEEAVVDRFIELSAQFYPDVARAARLTDAGIRISMTGPPAFLHNIAKVLQAHLDG